MKQSTVASALSTAFGNIGIEDHVSCTIVRKFAITAVHRKHPKQKHKWLCTRITELPQLKNTIILSRNRQTVLTALSCCGSLQNGLSRVIIERALYCSLEIPFDQMSPSQSPFFGKYIRKCILHLSTYCGAQSAYSKRVISLHCYLCLV